MKSTARLVLGVTTTLFAVVGIADSATAANLWTWSIDGQTGAQESGTFTTLESGRASGEYEITDFAVVSSTSGGTIGSVSGGEYSETFDFMGQPTSGPNFFTWDDASGLITAFSGSDPLLSAYSSGSSLYAFSSNSFFPGIAGGVFGPTGFLDAGPLTATPPATHAVPVPALLPGLFGFGATVLRKRKQAQSSAA